MSLADIETALGMPLAEAKALLAAGKKPKEEPKGETLKGADLELAKMKALMQRNVPSGLIPVLLQFLNITGTTPAEINASLDALAQAKMLPQEGQQQQGQGERSCSGWRKCTRGWEPGIAEWRPAGKDNLDCGKGPGTSQVWNHNCGSASRY